MELDKRRLHIPAKLATVIDAMHTELSSKLHAFAFVLLVFPPTDALPPLLTRFVLSSAELRPVDLRGVFDDRMVVLFFFLGDLFSAELRLETRATLPDDTRELDLGRATISGETSRDAMDFRLLAADWEGAFDDFVGETESTEFLRCAGPLVDFLPADRCL